MPYQYIFNKYFFTDDTKEYINDFIVYQISYEYEIFIDCENLKLFIANPCSIVNFNVISPIFVDETQLDWI